VPLWLHCSAQQPFPSTPYLTSLHLNPVPELVRLVHHLPLLRVIVDVVISLSWLHHVAWQLSVSAVLFPGWQLFPVGYQFPWVRNGTRSIKGIVDSHSLQVKAETRSRSLLYVFFFCFIKIHILCKGCIKIYVSKFVTERLFHSFWQPYSDCMKSGRSSLLPDIKSSTN